MINLQRTIAAGIVAAIVLFAIEVATQPKDPEIGAYYLKLAHDKSR